MKKSIFILINALALVCSLQVNAALPATQEARKHRAELVKKQDELLELLLQVPFEQRQYIFPLFAAKQSVPKKIKTHPEILVWKGKRPTRIADRFKDDEELIQYLPEQFYYFLAPEMWGPKGENIMEGNPNQILQNMMTNQANANNIPTALPEELTVLNDGMDVLQKWVQQMGKQPDFPLFFEEWIKSAPKDIQEKIQEKTSESPTEFGKKIDLVSKAYRLYTAQKIPPASKEQKLVQEYWSLIPFIFQKAGFRDALNATLYKD